MKAAPHKRKGAPGPGSPLTGLRQWGGDPLHLGTGDNQPAKILGAPNLDFETWDTSTPRCPVCEEVSQ
jgi:hypothetical protein